jgi:glycosyltransferase involved in cell wall biosynthesis
MVKYLSRLGWDITVITATTPRHYPVDPELEKQIPGSVEIIRIPVVWEGSTFRRLLGRLNLDWIPQKLVTPDERIFWVEKASSQAKKLLKKSGFDILYTTGPPFSLLMGGLWLKREKWNETPWVAEFRDPWTLAPYLSIHGANHRRVARETEDDLMRLADKVVMVTPSFAKMMRAKYPGNAVKVECVPNGFDEEDFRHLPVKGDSHNEKLTIAAAGTVFGRYNMDEFLKGLIELKRNEPGYYEKISVKFQGLPDYRLNRFIIENNLNDRCSSRGFVPHARNIRDLWTSDLLVLPLADVENSEGHIPSRTYEYLASGTPVLAICPDGDLADLVAEFPQVSRVKPGDTSGIVEIIKDAVAAWERNDLPPDPDPNALRSQTRRSRAKELHAIIKKLTVKG